MGVRHTPQPPQYKAILIPSTPEETLQFQCKMQQWLTQHKILDNNPVKAGLWLHQLSKAATRTISIIVNPGKFSMKPGFSPTGLIISKTINTLSHIRRAIRTAEWNAASQIARTVKSLNHLKKAHLQIIQPAPSDSPAHSDILTLLADSLYQMGGASWVSDILPNRPNTKQS